MPSNPRTTLRRLRSVSARRPSTLTPATAPTRPPPKLLLRRKRRRKSSRSPLTVPAPVPVAAQPSRCATRRAAPLRRGAAVHGQQLGHRVRAVHGRVHRQPVPRLHGRAHPGLHHGAPAPRRGPVPGEQLQVVVDEPLHPDLPADEPARGGGHRRGRRGPVLPQRGGGGDVPPGAGRGRVQIAAGVLHGRLPQDAARRVRAGACHGHAQRRPVGHPAPPPAAHHLAPPVPRARLHERARHGGHGGQPGVRRADRGARHQHRHVQVRAAGELVRRDGGRPRRRAHQHGVPACRRRGGAGGAVRAAGVAGAEHVRGAVGGDGGPLPGVRGAAGRDDAERAVPERSPGAEGPHGHPQAGVERAQDHVPGQAERAAAPGPPQEHLPPGAQDAAARPGRLISQIS
ncbi:Glycosyltransferase [Zea mays]|uniref:Glycosyltransferase n=1 Tax=Zea mays TaxID=4577 RepID=A0A1D6N4F1_MAIZE|nr:Glycosyltransferase [Zea mays]